MKLAQTETPVKMAEEVILVVLALVFTGAGRPLCCVPRAHCRGLLSRSILGYLTRACMHVHSCHQAIDVGFWLDGFRFFVGFCARSSPQQRCCQ